MRGRRGLFGGALLASLLSAVAAHGQAFEVASVRPHQGTGLRTSPLAVSGPLIRLQGYTLFGLVMDAYHLRDFQLEFGPVARRTDVVEAMYDISAKVPGDGIPKLDDVRAMLRTLLAERFGLQVHREMREIPVYVLGTGKGPGKLVPAASEDPCTVRTKLAGDGRNDEVQFTGCTTERLADTLTHLVGDRPVVDRIGLSGQYDFRLITLPWYRGRNRSEPADIDPVTAIARLGLKMTTQKTPVEILVVDRIEKPGEN